MTKSDLNKSMGLFICLCLMFAHCVPSRFPNITLPSVSNIPIVSTVKEEGRKVVTKAVGDKAISRWLENAPISTSFEDANYEVAMLSELLPEEGTFLPLSAQLRNKSGDFLLNPGAYSMTARSFCLHAGTHGPSQGDGHLLAPLKGKRADFVQEILTRYGQHPEVSQQKVQVLLWAIVAGADMNTLSQDHINTIYKLFTVEDFVKFKAKHMIDGYVSAQKEQLSGRLKAQLTPILNAEEKMRGMVQQVNVPFVDFETVAMLAGVAPESDMIRQVSKGRWSFHPDGYFVRFFPHGYRNTKIDVIVPEDVRAEMDDKGRVTAIEGSEFGRIGLHYAEEVYAGGSAEGFYQYFSNLTGITVDGREISLKSPISLPFITQNEMNGTLDSRDGQGELLEAIGKAEQLAGVGGSSAGRCPPNAESAVYLPIVIGAIRLGMAFRSLRECCDADNLSACLLKKAAQGLLLKSIWKYLKGRVSPFSLLSNQKENMASAVYYGATVAFNPCASVAAPANTSSQRIAIAPIPVDPPPSENFDWLKNLPKCPCNLDDASGKTAFPEGRWERCNSASQTHHYGASYEARWVPAALGGPGQQCTYDKNKKLIGYGIAAGSADYRSPGTCGNWDGLLMDAICPTNVSGHWWHDVKNWGDMPCEEYMRIRPSSNELCYEKNPINDWHFGQMCVFVQGMSCPDIIEVFKRFRDADDVPLVMNRFMEQGQLNNQDEISGVIAFLNKCAAEKAFNDEPLWHQSFILRVRDYVDGYKKNGQNPPPCTYKAPIKPPEWQGKN